MGLGLMTWADVLVFEGLSTRAYSSQFKAVEPRIFDPDRATGYYQHDDDDPVDIEEFIKVIYEARDR